MPGRYEQHVRAAVVNELVRYLQRGKYERASRPSGETRLGEEPGRGVEAYDKRNTETTWHVLDVVGEIAIRSGRSMAEVAIAWLLRRPGVASVLLGARTSEQLHQVLATSSLTLADDDVAALTVASAPGIADYPYAMLEELSAMTVWAQLGTK